MAGNRQKRQPPLTPLPVKILAVCGAKGGVGKTTTALAVGYSLARADWQVVIRDMDPQASATLALGQEPSREPWTAPPVDVEGVQLYRGGRALASGGTAQHTPTTPDLLLLDTPPALGALTLEAIRAADLVLVPLRPTPLDLPALSDVAAVVREMERPPILRAVLTQVHSRRTLTGDVAELIHRDYPGVLCRARIPEDVRAAEAPGFGRAVTLYAPSSRSARAYSALTVELIRDLTGWTP